ncbi:MAG: CRISPR-associated protein Csn2-St [Eubacterium sp.]|nr:CRISPR-associated protein Csn2-St [Eubacterium sp.]
MILNIKNKAKSYEVNIGGANQWSGTNIIEKDMLLNMITKYFSKEKYKEYDGKLECTIYSNKEELGRGYYTVYQFNSREELFSQLKIGKNTYMFKYISNRVLSEYNTMIGMEKISDELTNIYKYLNEEIFQEFDNVELDFEISKLFNIIQDSIIFDKSGNDIHNLSIFELIKNNIKLIEKLEKNSGNKVLVIFKNIDHLLTKEEYKKIYKLATNLSDITNMQFIFTLSIDGYCIVNENNIEEILVVNDEEITLPEYERIREFVQNNYPINIELNDKWLIENLENCINRLGRGCEPTELTAEIILSIINKTIHINCSRKFRVNNIELDFIKSN